MSQFGETMLNHFKRPSSGWKVVTRMDFIFCFGFRLVVSKQILPVGSSWLKDGVLVSGVMLMKCSEMNVHESRRV